TDAQLGIFIGVQHDPAFILSPRIAACPGRRVIRVHLHGQALGREQIFDHDVERAVRRRLEPYFPDLPLWIDMEARIDALLSPGLVDNFCGKVLHQARAATSSFSGRKANPIELSEMPYGMNSWSPTRIPPQVYTTLGT